MHPISDMSQSDREQTTNIYLILSKGNWKGSTTNINLLTL